MATEVLTTRQKEILEYIVSFQKRMGRTPTGPEIASHFRFKDPSPAYQHLRLMEKKGYLVLVKAGQGRPLGIRLTEIAQRMFTPSWSILGAIPAGPLSDVLAETDRHIRKLEDLIPDLLPGDFFLSVSGDSMIDAGLVPGQYVIVRPGCEPKNGDICAVWVEGSGGTLKRVFFEDGFVRLQPANRAYKTQIYPADIVRIQGVAVAALAIESFKRQLLR
jgi:repressor LexA